MKKCQDVGKIFKRGNSKYEKYLFRTVISEK